MTRPTHLPDYRTPPLNEFVLGIQFAPPPSYQQIYAGEVWSLFKDKYPQVQEQDPLPPAFETFGVQRGNMVNFGFVTGPSHDRFWFMSNSGNDLLQFQRDKLIHNWRNLRLGEDKYPRFEALIATFRDEANLLQDYFKKKLGQDRLSINQCEISYVNHIRPAPDQPQNIDEWLSFLNFGGRQSDDFSVGFRRTISGSGGRPLGRLTCEAATAFDPSGKPFTALTLTARGAPETENLDGALAFLARSREMLLKLFAEVTTEAAQQIWGKV